MQRVKTSQTRVWQGIWCYIARYFMWNIHICKKTLTMFITHRNPKKHETLTTLLVQVRNFYLHFFEFKVFRHEQRETQFLSMLTIPSDPTTCAHTLSRKLLVWPRRAPKIDLLYPSLNLNSLFFFRAWGHSHPRLYFLSGVCIVTSVIVTSAQRAREHLHSMCAPY